MFIFQTECHATELRERLLAPKAEHDKRLAYELDAAAKKAMTLGPWSVVYTNPERRASDNPHDYYSEAPYWWPNPDDPTGPFIRRDGEVFPGRFNEHRREFVKLSHTVLTLCAAGYYRDKPEYLDRATLLLDTWFVAADTHMSPHMQYAQAIKGICTGRGIGMIELGNLNRIVHATGFLSGHGGASQTIEGFKAWLAKMLDWCLTSEYGIEESLNGNNHETCWNVHVGTYAVYLGRPKVLELVCNNFKTRILDQLAHDGSMPLELARTKSLNYSVLNLNAMAVICELAHYNGQDLWHFERTDGRGMKKALQFLAPFLDNPFLWKHPAIDGDQPTDCYALQMGAIRLNKPEYLNINQKRASGTRLIQEQKTPFGPLALLPGWSGSSTAVWVQEGDE